MTSKTKKIIKQIAIKNGVSPAEVEADMREAMQAGMASTDPRAQELWKQIAPDGKEPSIDRFLEFVSGRVKSEMN